MKSIIFGAGSCGRNLKKGLEQYYQINISAVCDNNESKWGETIDDVPIIAPQKLLETDFDRIFVCVSEEPWYTAVIKQLTDMGISRDKIINMETSTEYQDAFLTCDPIRKHWIKTFADYSREMEISGNIAECGVYNGETSMFMNKYWPDRTLYLFDTFEGFSEKDIAQENKQFDAFKNGRFSKNPFKVGSSESLINAVKTRMLYPEKLKIYQGYFPESAGNIDDTFCFVSLDMDLYQPQLEGLRYFWNRMEEGGVILLHDYFSPTLPGVKAAVADFEKELGKNLPKFPIGDSISIAVIKSNVVF